LLATCRQAVRTDRRPRRVLPVRVARGRAVEAAVCRRKPPRSRPFGGAGRRRPEHARSHPPPPGADLLPPPGPPRIFANVEPRFVGVPRGTPRRPTRRSAATHRRGKCPPLAFLPRPEFRRRPACRRRDRRGPFARRLRRPGNATAIAQL